MKNRINGILLIDKPKSVSSNRVLQTVKRLYQANKAGHTGSLDPLATGMLPICFGEATKFSQFWLDADKYYRTTGCLGIKTDTGDADGIVIQQEAQEPIRHAQLEKVLESFVGSVQQIPPMFSALKHEGKPLYQYARAGIHIEKPPRTVTIACIKLIEFKHPNFTIEVACSKGTYIRTLVEDIGDALGLGAHVTQLHRVYTSGFENDPVYTPEALEAMTMGERLDCLCSMDKALSYLKTIILEDQQRVEIQQGKTLDFVKTPSDKTEIVKLYTRDNVFHGLGELRPNGMLRAKRLLSYRSD